VGGVIEKDSKGEPTGVFYNHRAMDQLRKVLPKTGAAEAHEWIRMGIDYCRANGVTTYHDNNVRLVDTIGAYLDMHKAREIPLRGAIFYTLEWPVDLDKALNQVPRYSDSYVRMAGFKFLIDGQPLMSYCHEKHTGMRWDLPTWDPKNFKQTVRVLHDTGLQISVHCAGDAATDLALDAFEEAMNATPRPDPRHRIEHAILTTSDATKRMKDLGVVVCTQPTFVKMGEHYERVWGTERTKRILVFREWLEAGVHTVVSSDAPTVPWYSPQTTLAASLERLTVANRSFHPEHNLTIQEALRAHTMEAAYAGHEERIKGSIEPGKLADLVVWKEDLFNLTWQRMWNTTVAMTIVGGEVVYEA
jgi:predicted amidohydrolase YtcJ